MTCFSSLLHRSMPCLLPAMDLANEDHILETVNSLLALRTQVEKSLKSMGVTGELHLLHGKISPRPLPPRLHGSKKLIEKAAAAPPPRKWKHC